MENSLEHKLDGLQSGIDHKIDNLKTSISRLSQQHVHQKEENLEEECILGEPTQMQPQGELMHEPLEAPKELPTREAGEEHQRLTLQSIPKNLDTKATSKPKDSPLPAASSPDPMYTLPAAQFTPEAPNGNATPFALPWLHNFRKLVAIAQAFATTSKKMAAADVAWHSRWFECWFRFGAPEPRHC